MTTIFSYWFKNFTIKYFQKLFFFQIMNHLKICSRPGAPPVKNAKNELIKVQKILNKTIKSYKDLSILT